MAASLKPISGSDALLSLMRAAAFNSLDGPEVLQPCLRSVPAPAKGRVLVRVVAAGLNPIDAKIRSGQAFPFTPLTRLPKIPGGDLAGVVQQSGPGSRFKPGDRVFACSDSFFPHVAEGTYAEFASVAEGQLAPMPAGLGFEEAAVVPLVALTAWQGIANLPLPPGSRILVHGSSGGVGSMAVQLAKRLKGWHVTATCSPKNASYVHCLQMGADVLEDYHDPGLHQRYSQGRESNKFDVVLDVIGGSTTRSSLSVLKRRGHLVHVWTNAERWVHEAGSEALGKLACVTDLMAIKLRSVLRLGPQLRLVLIRPDGRQLGEVAALLEKRAIHAPRISRAFPLDRAGNAHAYFEGGHAAGKVLIKVSQP